MAKEYVEQRNGEYYVADTRISLDSLVYAFLRGESPEGVAESFPALSLEQIFGALTFYLANREPIDKYLEEGKEKFELLRKEAHRKNPALYARLKQAHQRTHSSR